MEKAGSHGMVSVLLGFSLLFASCASVSVRNVSRPGKQSPTKPAHVYVERFSIEKAFVKENFARRKQGQLKIEARDLLAKALVAELNKAAIPASIAPPGRNVLADSWIVSGQILRVEEGSRFLRMGIGLGAGRTKLDTQVQVREASGLVFLRFATTGGSGATPGAATNPAPFSSLPTALLHTKEGATDDAERTARMIAAMIGETMAKRGWISSQNVPKAKLASN